MPAGPFGTGECYGACSQGTSTLMHLPSPPEIWKTVYSVMVEDINFFFLKFCELWHSHIRIFGILNSKTFLGLAPDKCKVQYSPRARMSTNAGIMADQS